MTWQEVDQKITQLSQQIEYVPDIIIGIVRGGIIPARLLAGKLQVKHMYCVTVKKVGKERKVMSDIVEDINGKRVLLIEDMLETGQSLLVAKDYLEKKGASVKTACLYTMPISEIKPDYSLQEVKQIVDFPWE